MQGVPGVPLQATLAGFRAEDNPHPLALRSLGPGHGGTIQDGTRPPNSSTCRGGQVHQVDRSKAHQEIEWSDCSDFHRRHHDSVRHTAQHHHRQRHKLCQRCLGPFLRDSGHPTGPSVRCPSAVKRPGRASKRPHPVWHKTSTGRTTRAFGRLLGRVAANRPVESAHDSKQVNRLHALLPRLRCRTCHPNGHRV